MRARTGAGVSRQPGNALCAASTAVSTSPGVDSGTSPRVTRWSAGERLGAYLPLAVSAHLPPMKLRQRAGGVGRGRPPVAGVEAVGVDTASLREGRGRRIRFGQSTAIPGLQPAAHALRVGA